MLTAISTIYYILKSLFFFCYISLRNIRNISPPYKYCIIKFIYVVILSVFVETAFSRYFENYFSYSLEIWQHQFSQVEEAISKKSALGFYLFKEMRELIFVWKSIRKYFSVNCDEFAVRFYHVTYVFIVNLH